MRVLATLLLAASLSAALCAQADATADPVPLGRLPAWAAPESYQLALRIDPRSDGFSGTATIRIRLDRATDHLWLNARALHVDRVQLRDAAGHDHAARWQPTPAPQGVARLDFDGALPAQRLTLAIDYHAPFDANLAGLYKVRFDGRDYAMTQMEEASARLAFPGFDDPQFKTPFDVRLTVPADMTAIANTAQVAQASTGPGWKTVRFAPSRPLPTYLVALAVGPWDRAEAADIAPGPERAGAVPLRAFAVAGQAPRSRTALAETPAILHALEDYYGVGYPFGKLDFLATPDFAAGAMENPGLITFRDWMFLLDADSSPASVRTVFNTVAHELSHQWSGNLVTMRWWNDIWLNESFAVWMQQKLEARLHPEYHADLERVIDAERIMPADSMASAGAIRAPVAATGDPGSNLPGVHSKGAMVLGMFERYVGADAFQRGMRAYMRAHAFGTAVAADLVDAVAQAAGQGDAFRRAFMSFLDQPGVPQLDVQLDASTTPVSLRVRQHRYLPPGGGAGSGGRWGIPLCVRYGAVSGVRRSCRLLQATEEHVDLPGADANSWVFPNADGAAYARVAMAPAALARLAGAVGALNGPEQVAYADTVLLALEQRRIDLAAALHALTPLADSATWDIAHLPLAALPSLRQAAGGNDGSLRDWANARYLQPLRTLGVRRRPGEPADHALERAALLQSLGVQLRVPEARDALRQLAAKALTGTGEWQPQAIDAELLAPALTVAVQDQGAPAVDRLLDVLRRENDPARRNAAIAALAATTDARQAGQVRDAALAEPVKVGEMGYLLRAGADEGRALRDARWNWFVAKLPRLRARLGTHSGPRLAAIAAQGACSPAEADRLVRFFDAHRSELSGADRAVAKATETIALCAAKHPATAEN